MCCLFKDDGHAYPWRDTQQLRLVPTALWFAFFLSCPKQGYFSVKSKHSLCLEISHVPTALFECFENRPHFKALGRCFLLWHQFFSDNLSLFTMSPCNCCTVTASSHEGTLQMKTADTERWDKLTEMRSHAQSVRIIVWVQSCVTDFIYRDNCVNNETTRRYSILDKDFRLKSTWFIWAWWRFLCVEKALFVCARLRLPTCTKCLHLL